MQCRYGWKTFHKDIKVKCKSVYCKYYRGESEPVDWPFYFSLKVVDDSSLLRKNRALC